MHWSVNLSPGVRSQARTQIEILFKKKLFFLSEVMVGKI